MEGTTAAPSRLDRLLAPPATALPKDFLSRSSSAGIQPGTPRPEGSLKEDSDLGALLEWSSKLGVLTVEQQLQTLAMILERLKARWG